MDRQHSAFLVDGEHFPPALVGQALALAQTTRNVTIRHIYASWGEEGIPQPWREVMEQHALCYQPADPPASGQNAVIMTLVIDALKLLYRDGIRSFVLVGDERDYAPLVSELLRARCAILGIGAPDIRQYPTTPYALIEPIGQRGGTEPEERSDHLSASA